MLSLSQLYVTLPSGSLVNTVRPKMKRNFPAADFLFFPIVLDTFHLPLKISRPTSEVCMTALLVLLL